MVEWLAGLYGGTDAAWFFSIITWILVIVAPLLVGVAFAVYADRKIWAAMQLRRGPNVVGPFGLLQSFADGLKLFIKETIVPAGANKGIFILAPMLTFVLALIGWAVIPWGEGAVLADINVGIFYIFAISSLGVYGIIMAGWASNSRYAFLGGLRSAAQMVSYEVSMGFVLVTVISYAGSPSLSELVHMQSGGIWNWNFLWFFPMFVIFLISAMAETNRPPFDLPEAEAELVAGYQVEYSSMAFALFWLGEYGNILLMCALSSVLFFGGWYAPIPALDFIPGPLWMIAKICFFFFIFAWVKATVPRYRYDQLMRLGWKVFLPVSLAAVVFYTGWGVAFGYIGK
ncbi:NADH-quinone oxidoreductase subunit H [Iodidimonas muriae]|uniref:NADH-quinone oxidoreductase subunit H n=1 Tax=Iodidimonas muriae TaxID=261467 RepID=A0ABQ2L7J7_9PROT|nr:NADH-quinone oxidoreductase subunit NuoH [Iodidimonas muriae]GER08400.1 NADH-quinone oxidoreductase subunit H [Kordiimonadales bacterium JCM 17843]GGO05906.1 NADH-quinone oxidoreductase subunit H [Iodidimonas muriae]